MLQYITKVKLIKIYIIVTYIIWYADFDDTENTAEVTVV